MTGIMVGVVIFIVIVVMAAFIGSSIISARRNAKNYERGLKMIPLLIHLPPSTDDIEIGGRDERDVTGESLNEAQVMYNIISSTMVKGFRSKIYGQRHMSFEIIAHDGFIRYYAVVPAVLLDIIKQAISAAYPTARLEEVMDPNMFSREGGANGTAGGELMLKEDYWLQIATYEESKRDASLAILNALSVAKKGDGIALQILFRPADTAWTKKALERVQNIRDGKRKTKTGANLLVRGVYHAAYFIGDVAEALWKPPDQHEGFKSTEKVLTNLEQEEIQNIEEKTKYPGFEVMIRVIASAATKTRAESLLSSLVAVFSQFDSQHRNGFRYDGLKDVNKLINDFILRYFPQTSNSDILNSVEMATLFHLPSQNVIPTSQVERQLTKQVDGPAKLADEGVLLGVNEFRGEIKEIRLSENDRRRHTYVIGATGMGKSVLLTNIAYQDMMDGRGFAFIDPHGDAVELLMSKVPPERVDDIIYFDPGDTENPIGMNMFEFNDADQKDFIVQEGINMLQSLYDPGNQGIFGPRAHHMFRNAALLLMSDPEGGTFIDVPRCFTDAEFVKAKLKYVTDRTVYDYWTKEFPATQKSSEAGEVTTWFVSKWGPFLSNKMMRNILGQQKSGFGIREIMDEGKILLVNLSKGKMGELNSKLLGMIFVMKFQTAAMGRANIAEDERRDFSLFVDEFQNFSTESFESILSEARKYRLNLVLANQFMTQLTDKIREGILGNVGTIMSGRLGVTDAELMEKAFSPVFNAEDLHKLANHSAVATVMIFGIPSSPFTMKLLPPMGDSNSQLLASLRKYSAVKYGRPMGEVDREINARLMGTNEAMLKEETKTVESTNLNQASEKRETVVAEKKTNSFLDAWTEKKRKLETQQKYNKSETTAAKSVKIAEKETNEEMKNLNVTEKQNNNETANPDLGLKIQRESAQVGANKNDTTVKARSTDETIIKLR